MSNEKLNKTNVNPIILTDVKYDAVDEFIDDFETLTAKPYASVSNLELNTSERFSGASSLQITTGLEDEILLPFNNIGDYSGFNEYSNIELCSDNFTYEEASLQFDKTGTSPYAGIRYIFPSSEKKIYKDYKQLGLLAVNLWIDTEADAQKIKTVKFNIHQEVGASTEIYCVWNCKDLYFKRGWNIVIFDIARTEDVLHSSFVKTDELYSIGIEIETNNTTDTLTDCKLNALRVFHGADCYIEEDLEVFDDSTVWTATNGAVSDSTTTRTGTSSVALSKTDTSINYSYMQKTVTLDLSKSGICKIDFYVSSSDFSKIQCLRIGAEDNGNWRYWYFEAMKSGWNTAYVNLCQHDQDSGSIYSYEGVNEVTTLEMLIWAHNVTDTISGVVFDLVSFPASKANKIDLPLGVTLRDTLTTALLGASNRNIVKDTDNKNMRHAVQFDTGTTYNDNILRTTNHVNTNSNQCEIRRSGILAYDFYIPSDSDDTHVRNAYLYGNNATLGTDLEGYRLLKYKSDENYNRWRTMRFNVNKSHYKTDTIDYTQFDIYTDKTAMTGLKIGNFRTVKEDNLYYGLLPNASWRNWIYDSSNFKPEFWHCSDSSVLLEKNANPFIDSYSIRIENTDLVDEISIVQDESTDLGGTSIKTHNQDPTRFYCHVYAEKAEKVYLRVTSGSNIHESSCNKYADTVEKLYVEFTGDEIDKVEIVIKADSGLVDVARPRVIPIRWNHEFSEVVIDPMDDCMDWSRAETIDSITYSTGELSTTSMDRKYLKGITFTKDSGVDTGLVFFKDFNIRLGQFRRILVDVYIKDGAAYGKIKDTIDMRMIRNLDNTGTTTDEVVLKYTVSTTNNINTGWNTLSWEIPWTTKEDYSKGSWLHAMSCPVSIFFNINTANATDTFAAGDIIFSNLRVAGTPPYCDIESFSDISSWGKTLTTMDVDVEQSTFTSSGNYSLKLTCRTANSNVVKVNKDDYNLSLLDLDKIMFNIYSEDMADIFYIQAYIYDSKGYYGFIVLHDDAASLGSKLEASTWCSVQGTIIANQVQPSAYEYTDIFSHICNLNDIVTVEFWIKALDDTVTPVVYFSSIQSTNLETLPYMNNNNISNLTTSTSDVISVDNNGGYIRRTYLKFSKANTTYDYAYFYLNNSTIIMNLRNVKHLYIPILIPSAAYSSIVSFKFGLEKDYASGGWTDYREYTLLASEITADEWYLWKVDLLNEDDFIIIGDNDLMNNKNWVLLVYATNAATTFSDIKFGHFMTENYSLNHSGIQIDYETSLPTSEYIGLDLYIPSEEVLPHINSLNLTLNKHMDYTDSRLYKMSTDDLKTGWNNIRWNLSDYYLDTYKTTDEAITSIQTFKFYLDLDDTGINLEGILIDRFATYATDTDEVLRSSKIDIIGSNNGKYWEGRLLKAGTVTRKLSEQKGLVELPKSKMSLADTDDKIADIYGSLYGISNFLNNEVNISVGADGDSESDFQNIYKGYVSDLTFKKKTATISSSDTLESFMIDLPKNLLDTSVWTNAEDNDSETPLPIIYNDVSSDVGALPLLNAGAYSNVVWYIVAGHHCKTGTLKIYHDGELYSGSYTVDYDYTSNSQDYTVVKVSMILDDDGDYKNPWEEDYTVSSVDYTAPEKISCSITGKTTDGSSSSDVIENVTDVLLDILTVEMFIPTDRINTSNFATVEAYLSQNGQEAAGAIVKNISADNLLADFLVSHNLSMYIDKDGLICLYYFKPSKSDENAPFYTDEVDIIAGSFTLDTGMKSLVNRIRARGKFNYSDYYDDDDKSWEYNTTETDSDSLQRVGKYIDWDDDYLEMKWNRNDSAINSIVTKLILRYRNGRAGAKLTLPMSAYNNDIGDKIRITHYDGVSISRDKTSTSWSDHLCVIKGLTFNPDKCTVTVDVDSIQDLAQDCSFLGNRDDMSTGRLAMTQFYYDADDTEREYLYLPYRATGKFRDGDDGHKLC